MLRGPKVVGGPSGKVVQQAIDLLAAVGNEEKKLKILEEIRDVQRHNEEVHGKAEQAHKAVESRINLLEKGEEDLRERVVLFDEQRVNTRVSIKHANEDLNKRQKEFDDKEKRFSAYHDQQLRKISTDQDAVNLAMREVVVLKEQLNKREESLRGKELESNQKAARLINIFEQLRAEL